MKSNKLVITVVIIAFSLLLIVFGVVKCTNNIKDSQKEYNKAVDLIIEKYQDFSTLIVEYNNTREQLINYVNNDFYFENFSAKNEEIRLFFIEYEDLMTRIETLGMIFEDNCSKIKNDTRVSDKCETYYKYYETVMNVYVSDTIVYNKQINDYNLWIKKSDQQLDLFETKFKDYIDINTDNIYLGKEN